MTKGACRRTARLTLAAAGIALALSACGSGNSAKSTPPAKTTANASASPFVLVRILNNTSSSVKFLQCRTTTCTALHERRTLAPGGRTLVLGSNQGVRFGYLVENTAGKRLGCIYMDYDHVRQPSIVEISSMGSCE